VEAVVVGTETKDLAVAAPEALAVQVVVATETV
jgi:hypothetical protein